LTALEKFAGTLGRLFGPPRLFLAVLAWVLLLGVWGSIARAYLPMAHRNGWDDPLQARAPLYARFDSGWYLSIMELGYGPPPPSGKSSNHAFFPLYPYTAKILHEALSIDGFYAGLIVSYLCLFLAMPLLYREALLRQGEGEARAAVAFLLLFPTSFFLAAVYAESMFLLFALLALRDARSGPIWRAALFAALLSLTRASAIAAAPALLLAALERPAGYAASPEPRPRRLWRALLLGAVPLVVVFGWIYGIGIVHGEPDLFFRSMGGWDRPTSSWHGIWDWFYSMGLRFKHQSWRTDPSLALDYAATALFALAAVFQLRRRRWSDAAWTGGALLLPMTTGLSGGMPRFLLVVYPAYFAMTEASRGRRVLRRVWWALSAAALLFFSARFVNWLWVA
jgi:hypothetical protein